MSVNASRDYFTVANNLVEAALFPALVTGGPSYTTFSESAYTSAQRFKGRQTFDRQGSKTSFPFILWFTHDCEMTWNATQVRIARPKVLVLIAHQNPDVQVAYQTVERDLNRVIDVCMSQVDNPAMTLGPFCYQSTDVVPSSFGTVYHVDFDPEAASQEIGVNPKLGKDVVVGHVELTLEIEVQS